MSLQRTLPWAHSKNPGETFGGWATESRQLSVSVRQMLAHRIYAKGGGCLLPTPKATDGSKGSRTKEGAEKEFKRGKNVDLGMVVAMLPTPTANCSTGAGSSGRQGGLNLQTHVARFPTPVARDWKYTGTAPAELARHTPPLATHAGGQLNPTWVEWLMQWPLEWTALKP